jgi:hypothetical protein
MKDSRVHHGKDRFMLLNNNCSDSVEVICCRSFIPAATHEDILQVVSAKITEFL